MSSSQWNDVISKSSEAKSVDDVHKLCTSVAHGLGFDRFLYSAQFPTSLVRAQIVIISAYAPEWRSHYDTMHYATVDPTVAYCKGHVTPIVWDQIDLSAAGAKARRVMSEACEFGLRSGISIPIRGTQGEGAMLSLVSSADHKKAKAHIFQVAPFAQFLSGFIHEASKRVFSESRLLLSEDSLTSREKECLLWAAEGKTTWETSQILKITERTVNFHLQNATAKLQVSNRAHAVARAISQHLISPQLA